MPRGAVLGRGGRRIGCAVRPGRNGPSGPIRAHIGTGAIGAGTLIRVSRGGCGDARHSRQGPLQGLLPAALQTAGRLFPFKHLVHAAEAALGTGQVAGGHLAVVIGWGLAGAMAAILRFRWQPKPG